MVTSTLLTYSRICHLNTVLKQSLSIKMLFREISSMPKQSHKAKSVREILKKKFIDFKKVKVIGGRGGDGCIAFSSLFRKEWAGPDGGDGGNGGHVVFQVSGNRKSLEHLQTVMTGEHGERGQPKNCSGKCAQHKVYEVPFGTIIKKEDGTLISSLEVENDYFIAARGGAGGKGNYSFLSNEERAPAFAEHGAKGEQNTYLIELRTMAHAGLIGFPNAGKSTLLRAISRARPKVAAYPFTTLNPHIGMVLYDDHEQIAVADIPGLISGAHQNKGLGISFLRHIQRCACLLYVIDLSVSEPWSQLEDLKFELEQYSLGLSERPHAIIGNKIDLHGSEDRLKELQEHVNLPVFPISAKKRTNIVPLLIHLREMYDRYAEKKGTGW